MKYVKCLFFVVVLLLNYGVASAHDFEVNGIFYNKISGNQVEVTYQGDSINANPNRYEGTIFIPASVTYNDTTYCVSGIGKFAFQKCQELTSVSIPKGVVNVGVQAFADCCNLTSVVLPKGLTVIGQSVFWGCSSLASVVIPKGVKEIGKQAFAKCSSLTSITVPKGVKSIERATFYECCGLTSIILPRGVESIGELAFKGCNSLSSITIPNGVKSIGSSAFRDCNSLGSVAIPKGMNEIGARAFARCSNLASVVIPKGVKSIGRSTFYGCSSLTSVVIPEGVKELGFALFEGCSNLTSVVIPKSVTSIGPQVFANCKSLTSIAIPESVTSIGRVAFYGCSNLASIVVPEGVDTIAEGTFLGCSCLASIIIPSSVTSIEYAAFRDCKSLTEIRIPENSLLTNIGDGAFEGAAWCDSLPNGVNYLGKVLYKFKGDMISDTDIVVKEGTMSIGEYAFSECLGLTSIVIPEGVISIGQSAFSDCFALTSVSIPSSMKCIGADAFENCRRLTAVHICSLEDWCELSFGNEKSNPLYYAHNLFLDGKSVTELIVPNGVEHIGSYAFTGCSGLSKVTISEGVKTIGNGVFSGCISLSSIAIPTSVTNIGSCAFENCSSLSSIIIPEGVKDIKDRTFYNCYSLRSVVVPEGVDSIGGFAFSGYCGLSSVVLPKSLKYIGEKAFANYTGVNNVYCLSDVLPRVEENAFNSDCDENITLHVSSYALKYYKKTLPWSDFGEIKDMGNTVFELECNNPDSGFSIDKEKKGGNARLGSFAACFIDRVDSELNRRISMGRMERKLMRTKQMNYDNELIDWSFVWEWLPQLKLREPYVVGCYKDGDMDFRYGMNVFNKERMGEYVSSGLLSAEATMFVTEEELPLNDKCPWDSIWNHIDVPFTEEGLWQAFLLDELWRMLPLGWHWAYHNDTYLLKLGDLNEVWKDGSELTSLHIEELEEPWKGRALEHMLYQQKEIRKLKKEEHLLLPHIEIDEKHHHAIIHYTYWSDWEGVVAVKLPVSHVNGSILWGEREKTVLLPYDCGILY